MYTPDYDSIHVPKSLDILFLGASNSARVIIIKSTKSYNSVFIELFVSNTKY